MQIMIEQQILKWKDTYKTRVEEELTNMFPQLELRLREQVERHALKILTGRPRKFTHIILEPEITHWDEMKSLIYLKK